MHLLIDITNRRALARAEEYMALAALAYIMFANVDVCIVRLGQYNREFTSVDHAVLRGIAQAIGFPVPPGATYGDSIKHVRKLVEGEAGAYLHLPFDVRMLYAQAASIDPRTEGPFAICEEGNEPVMLPEWTCEPKRNRSRYESPFWTMFHNEEPPPILGHRQNSATPWNPASEDATLGARTSPHTTQEPTVAKSKTAPAAPATPPPAPAKGKKAPAAPAAAAPAPAEKPAKAPKAPKEKPAKVERTEQNGVTRPKPGTTGDKIWSAADTISTKQKRPATVEEVQTALGDSVNEASLRTGFQRWRKFNGLKGRTPAAG